MRFELGGITIDDGLVAGSEKDWIDLDGEMSTDGLFDQRNEVSDLIDPIAADVVSLARVTAV